MKPLLIFDLDGTLVDCKELHQQAFRRAVLQQVPDATFEDSEVEGLPTTEKIKVLQSKGIPVTDELDDIKKQYTRDNVDEFIHYDPQLHNLISRLDNNYRMAICSNSRNEFVLKCLNILDLWQFELIFSRDYGYPKPDPWMFIQCMAITNTPPSLTWIFEDSEVGIESARRSGANVVAVENSDDLKRKLNDF